MKLIIVDRDGVINFDSPNYIKNVAEWQPIPGSLEALAKAYKLGYKLAIATNQAGIGRGILKEEELLAIHQELIRRLQELGATIYIAYCPHHPELNCLCRKPKPGLLQQISAYYNIDLMGVPYIGDSAKDVEAALAAGAKPIIVLTGNGLKTKSLYPQISAFSDLKAAVEALLNDAI